MCHPVQQLLYQCLLVHSHVNYYSKTLNMTKSKLCAYLKYYAVVIRVKIYITSLTSKVNLGKYFQKNDSKNKRGSLVRQ